MGGKDGGTKERKQGGGEKEGKERQVRTCG